MEPIQEGAHSVAIRGTDRGDAFYLLEGPDRELLVFDAERRETLWTSRVWPGGLLVGGELAGTWRRANAIVTIQPWRPLSPAERRRSKRKRRRSRFPRPKAGSSSAGKPDEP